MRYAAATLWCVWAIGSMAQDAPDGKSAVEGVARNTVTLLGVGQVSIHLIPVGGAAMGYAATSAADGSFRFEGVKPGAYRVDAQRTGYDTPAASTIRLSPGQVYSGTEMSLTPLGTISGKVTGPDGEPLRDASVTLIECRWQRGKRVYAGLEEVPTDDAGGYRFSGIRAGRYWVYATRPQRGPLALALRDAPDQPDMRIAGRYYPGVAQLDGASAVELHAGMDVSGVDCKLPLVRAFHVSGTYAGGSVVLKARLGDQALDWDQAHAELSKDGQFDIAVSAGAYKLETMDVVVDTKDVTGVVVPAAVSYQIKGRVRVEGEDPPETVPVLISAEGASAPDFDGLKHRTQPNAGGTFAIAGLAPDRYTLGIRNLDTGKEGGYYVKSLRVNGSAVVGREVDLTGASSDNVEVVVSSDVGGLEGTVTAAEAGSPIVVLIPAQVASGDTHPIEAYLDFDNHFTLTDLEPGTYRVFATPAYDRGLWQNAEFVREIASRGVTVEVAAKGSAHVEVEPLRAADVAQVLERIE